MVVFFFIQKIYLVMAFYFASLKHIFPHYYLGIGRGTSFLELTLDI